MLLLGSHSRSPSVIIGWLNVSRLFSVLSAKIDFKKK